MNCLTPRYFAGFIFLFLVALSTSCKKTDYNGYRQQSVSDAALIQKFFTTAGPVDPAVNKVMAKLRQYPAIIPALTRNDGWPRWEKAEILQTNYSLQSRISEDDNGNEKKKVLIPLVSDSAGRVQTMLACSIKQNDSVRIRVMRADDYKWYNAHEAQTGLSGQGLSLLFMDLSRKVFGNNIFKITDTLLFKTTENKAVGWIKLDSSISANRSVVTDANSYLACLSFTFEQWVPANQGQLAGCPPDGPCSQYVPDYTTITLCKWIIDDIPDPKTQGGDPITMSGPTGGTTGANGFTGIDGNFYPFPDDYFDPCDANLPPLPYGFDYPSCTDKTTPPFEPIELFLQTITLNDIKNYKNISPIINGLETQAGINSDNFETKVFLDLESQTIPSRNTGFKIHIKTNQTNEEGILAYAHELNNAIHITDIVNIIKTAAANPKNDANREIFASGLASIESQGYYLKVQVAIEQKHPELIADIEVFNAVNDVLNGIKTKQEALAIIFNRIKNGIAVDDNGVSIWQGYINYYNSIP